MWTWKQKLKNNKKKKENQYKTHVPFVHSTEFIVDVVFVVCLILWTQHGINHLVLSQISSSIKYLWLKKYHSQMFPIDLMWSKTHKNGMWEDISCVRCGKQYRFIYFFIFLDTFPLILWQRFACNLRNGFSFDSFFLSFFSLFLWHRFLPKNIITNKKKTAEMDKNVPRKKLMK